MNKRRTKYRTDFLLPKNNFIVGLGSVLNIAGSYFEYRTSKTNTEADLKALYSDWENVGEDFREAEREFRKINSDKLSSSF